PARRDWEALRVGGPEPLPGGAARAWLRGRRGRLRSRDGGRVGVSSRAPPRRAHGVTARLRATHTLRDWAILAAFLAYATPFFWQLLTSLKPEAELMVLPPLLPTRLTWEHYRVVLGQSVMLRALINSLGVGIITTVLALALGIFGAYGIARYPIPGKALLLLLIVGGTAFPQIATV